MKKVKCGQIVFAPVYKPEYAAPNVGQRYIKGYVKVEIMAHAEGFAMVRSLSRPPSLLDAVYVELIKRLEPALPEGAKLLT